MENEKKKGSLTIAHQRGDIIENTIGRLGGTIGSYIPLWTPEAIVHNISTEQAESLRERYKDVNWRGDVKVYLGHNPLLDQLKRLFFEPGRRRMNFFLRVFPGLPTTVLGWIQSKFFRSDYYNPATETVTTYNPNLAVAYHEIGHAEYFDRSNFPGIQALAGIFPMMRSYLEWAASNNAMKHLHPEERIKARKVLEPAWGTYAGLDAAIMGSTLFPALAPLIAPVAPYAPLIGLLVGHIHSRLPGSKNIFFDETSVENIPSVQLSTQSNLQPALAYTPAG